MTQLIAHTVRWNELWLHTIEQLWTSFASRYLFLSCLCRMATSMYECLYDGCPHCLPSTLLPPPPLLSPSSIARLRNNHDQMKKTEKRKKRRIDYVISFIAADNCSIFFAFHLNRKRTHTNSEWGKGSHEYGWGETGYRFVNLCQMSASFVAILHIWNWNCRKANASIDCCQLPNSVSCASDWLLASTGLMLISWILIEIKNKKWSLLTQNIVSSVAAIGQFVSRLAKCCRYVSQSISTPLPSP